MDRSGWDVDVRRGHAAELHARELDARRRLVEVVEVVRPALVLGSTQAVDDADADAAARAGVDVVRRRSGGGAVLVVPGETTWIDVTIPRHDPLWDDDVAKAFHWLGQTWARALDRLGIPSEVHTGPPRESPWSRLVCFAGTGAGEVVVAGRKVVGISQRRTRAGARFQCAVHRRWEPAPLLHLLALDDEARARATAALAVVADGVDRPAGELREAFCRSLP